MFASCETCYSCKYIDDSGVDSQTGELCDNKKELERFEADLQNRWSKNGDVICTNAK